MRKLRLAIVLCLMALMVIAMTSCSEQEPASAQETAVGKGSLTEKVSAVSGTQAPDTPALVAEASAQEAETQPEPAEPVQETAVQLPQPDAKPEPESDDFLFRICTDRRSGQFEAMGEPAEQLPGYVFLTPGEKVRFSCDADGVEVRLEKVDFLPGIWQFRSGEELFRIRTEAGAVYEFEGDLAETMPAYRLVAVKNNVMAVWYLTADGACEDGYVELCGETFEPPIPWEGDDITALCRIYARESVYAGSAIRDFPDLYWNTAGRAAVWFLLQDADTDDQGRVFCSEQMMDAVTDVLFPGVERPGFQIWDSVAYDPARGEEPYIIRIDLPDLDADTRYIETDEEETGVSELIAVDVGEAGEVAVRVYLEQDPDLNNVFGWIITDYAAVPAVG